MVQEQEEQHAAYTVIEEDSVREAVDAAVAKYPWADEVFEAAKFVISTNRFTGDEMPGTNPVRRLVYLRPNRLAKSPAILVRYYICEEPERDGYPVVDWVKFYDYDDEEAVTPAAYVHRA